MNITKHIMSEKKFLNETGSNFKKSLGFIDTKRKIILFIHESKNLNNIIGHNLVTSIVSLVINTSVFKIKSGGICYNKSVYLCDTEFPNHVDFADIKKNINNFIGTATIVPRYVFSNSHVINNEKFFDFGLTLIDLNLLDQSKYGLINYSKIDGQNPLFKEIIQGNEYNPKYYSILDANVDEYDEIRNRNHKINDLYDSNTQIMCNNTNSDHIDYFINNERKTGIYIDKRITAISDIITEFFSKFLFICVERVEFVLNSCDNSRNIKLLSFFTKFRSDVEDHYIDTLNNDINTIFDIIKARIKDDFYMIFRIDTHYIICDTIFISDNFEVRITRPIYKLYSDFSLETESILNSIDYNSNEAKELYLEHTIKRPDQVRFELEYVNGITAKTLELKNLVESSVENLKNTVTKSIWDGNGRYLENLND